MQHNELYVPLIDHWLMRESVGRYWSNDYKAAKRFEIDEIIYIKPSDYYVPTP